MKGPTVSLPRPNMQLKQQIVDVEIGCLEPHSPKSQRFPRAWLCRSRQRDLDDSPDRHCYAGT